MQPEDVVRKYQQRAGYRIADYAEVGLPIYAVTLTGLTMARKRIPPIEEFVLKCLDKSLSETSEISAFLGLDEQIVRAVQVSLAQAESIALLAEPGSQIQTLRLTPKGKRTIQTAEAQEPEARIFTIHYDALLRRARWYGSIPFLRYEALKERGLFEIQAFPARRPRLSDLDAVEVGRIVRALGNPDRYKRELLAVKSIEKTQKFYLPAVALTYVSNTGHEIQVAFAIDGILSRDHEIAYAQMGGPSKQGIESGLRSSVPGHDAALEAKNALGVDSERLRELAASATSARLLVSQAEEDLRDVQDNAERQTLEIKLKEAQENRLWAERELGQGPVVDLSTFDHPPLLQDALTTTRQRLLIIAPWIRGAVVDIKFLKNLENLLKNGVEVYIGYGISQNPTQDAVPEDQEAKDKLTHLARQYSNFHFSRLGNTHAKILVKDRDFAVVTSFNWLSFRGLRSLPFRDEQGVKIQRPNLVDQKFDQQAKRF